MSFNCVRFVLPYAWNIYKYILCVFTSLYSIIPTWDAGEVRWVSAALLSLGNLILSGRGGGAEGKPWSGRGLRIVLYISKYHCRLYQCSHITQAIWCCAMFRASLPLVRLVHIKSPQWRWFNVGGNACAQNYHAIIPKPNTCEIYTYINVYINVSLLLCLSLSHSIAQSPAFSTQPTLSRDNNKYIARS